MNEELGAISVCYAVHFGRRSKHSPERLWRAISEPAQVAAWMGYPARIDLRPGGEFTIDFDSTNPGDVLDGVIVRVEPRRRLQYVWGSSVVDWVIEPDVIGSSYTFAQSGLALRDVPDEERLVAGWHDFLESLDGYLDGRPRDAAAGRHRWEQLKPRYRALLSSAVGSALK